MMDFKLAAKILYGFFYAEDKVDNYKEIISNLIKYIKSLPEYTDYTS